VHAVLNTDTQLAAMPGGWEWLIILAVVLILFGNRIPGLARSLGSGISEFKSGLREGEKTARDVKDIKDVKPDSDKAEQADKSS
jgi:sec-independent protein translocase protein TatA